MIESIEFEQLTCWECGCTYFANSRFVEACIEERTEIYCPSGHTNGYGHRESVKKLEQLQAENEDLKNRLFQALHDAEQSEGRRAENKSPIEPAEREQCETVKNAPAVAPVGELPAIKSAPDSRCICPYCNARPWAVHIRQHLKRRHGVSDEAIARLQFADGIH